MKRFSRPSLFILFTFSLFFGCQTTENITNSISSSMRSFKSEVDEKLYAQVPEDQRGKTQKAEFDLRVAGEELKLAQLKKKLASQEKKAADYEEDLAENTHEKSGLALDVAKMEAIDHAGLGEKEANIKTIANMKSKKLKVESNTVRVEAKLASTKIKMETLRKQIRDQEELIQAIKSGDQEEKTATKESVTEKGEEPKPEPGHQPQKSEE